MSRRKSILMISPYAAVAAQAQDVLSQWYTVRIARTGEEALSLLKEELPGLILLMMPPDAPERPRLLKICSSIDERIPVISRCLPPERLAVAIRKALAAAPREEMKGPRLLPADMATLIAETVDEVVEKKACLKSALRSFRERYIDHVVEKCNGRT
jgi:hypothetical protein